MQLFKSDHYLIYYWNGKFIVTDGTKAYSLSAKLSTSSTGATPAPKVEPGEDEGEINLVMGDLTLPLQPASLEKLFPAAFFALGGECLQMVEKLEKAAEKETEMRQEQFKLRRELTSSIPMDAPKSAAASKTTSTVHKKGGSLLNPRVKKRSKVASKGASPFASDSSGSGSESEQEDK